MQGYVGVRREQPVRLPAMRGGVFGLHKLSDSFDTPKGLESICHGCNLVSHDATNNTIFSYMSRYEMLKLHPKNLDHIIWPMSDSKQIVGRRLELVMRVLGYEHQNQFATAIGTTPQTLSNVITGYSNLSKMLADKILRRHPEINPAYLWYGSETLLPAHLLKRIRELEHEAAGKRHK